MAVWLKQCAIRTVAMQSTGVYWIAVYDILEQAGLEELCLAKTRSAFEMNDIRGGRLTSYIGRHSAVAEFGEEQVRA